MAGRRRSSDVSPHPPLLPGCCWGTCEGTMTEVLTSCTGSVFRFRSLRPRRQGVGNALRMSSTSAACLTGGEPCTVCRRAGDNDLGAFTRTCFCWRSIRGGDNDLGAVRSPPFCERMCRCSSNCRFFAASTSSREGCHDLHLI